MYLWEAEIGNCQQALSSSHLTHSQTYMELAERENNYDG